MILIAERHTYGGKTYFTSALFTKNWSWTELGLNSGFLHCKASDCLKPWYSLGCNPETVSALTAKVIG
jgi:hypothetical protein